MTLSREAIEVAVASLAASQHTMITTDQATGCGLGRRAIAYRLATRHMQVVFHGVYSVSCGELPPLAREQGALLACGEGSFLSHHSAAFIWGLRKTPPPTVEVSVVRRAVASRDGIRVHRIKAIDRRELRREKGLWVSSPARVILELAAVAPALVPDAVDDALAARLITRKDLDDELARNRPCRGSGRLAELLGDETAMSLTRSKTEKRFLRLIRAAGLPMPETNVRLGRYEPDFLWRQQGLVVEIDGYDFHTGPRAFHRDREKDLVFRDLRLEVLRFTPDHVRKEPEMVLVRVAQELARRDRGAGA
jgi:very-short-patch-repair endonuclease